MNTSADVLLETRGIEKSFHGQTIISGIDLTLREGELVCLLGQSGAGKSTLFHVIAGLYQPDAGQVLLRGRDITGKPGYVSYMLQKDLLLEHKRVIDNVALPLVLKGVPRKEAREQADPYFAQFDLDGTQMLYPSALSGGMRQRAALLRTYLSSKGLILLDEPFSALDMITRSQMHDWYLDMMKKIRLSTILITHDADEAILLSDRICLLTGIPGEIRHEIRIDVSREERVDFAMRPEFIDYKRQIRELLLT